MGFYPPDALVHEAQRRGHGGAAAVRGARAAAECRVEDGAVRMGLGYVNGVTRGRGARDGRRARAGRALALARRPRRPLGGLRRDARQAGLGGRVRRAASTASPSGVAAAAQALWMLGVAVPGVQVAARHAARAAARPARGRPSCARCRAWERMLADYGSTGVTLREHPLELMRPGLPADLRTSRELERAPARAPGAGGRPGRSRASARRPRRASPSCCSRTSTARST